MDVAYVSDVAYPFVTGGAEKRIYDFGRELVARGHDVTLYTWTWWDGPDVTELDGMRLVGVGQPPPLYHNKRRTVREAMSFTRRLLPVIINGRHDLMDASQFPYLHLIPTRLASLVRNTPMVVSWYELWGRYWLKYMGAAGVAGWAFESLCARISKNNVAISQLAADRLKSLGMKNVIVIPPGIDVSCYHQRTKKEWGAIFVGRLIPEKGVELLLEALSVLNKRGKDVKTLIIGDGPQESYLKQLCSRLGLNKTVEFRPFMQKHNDMLSLLGSARVFAYPSRREGFGLAVLEAMALGVVPLLVRAPLNAAVELVGGGGMVVGADAGEYAEAMDGLVGDEMKLSRLSRISKRRVGGYDMKLVAEQLENYYEKVVND